MTLPFLVSVPHAGLWVPPEAEPFCRLTDEEIAADGDQGAAEIYELSDRVAAFVKAEVARAIVDVNRARDDRRTDGVVKTHTCWGIPVYDPFPPETVVSLLLDRYYRPYHERLAAGVADEICLSVDCHTMAPSGPPVGPDHGKPRPKVCLSDGKGTTLPAGWMDRLARCFADVFGDGVTVNDPFGGGYITRTRGRRGPCVQVELNRAPFASNADKRRHVLASLTRFHEMIRTGI